MARAKLKFRSTQAGSETSSFELGLRRAMRLFIGMAFGPHSGRFASVFRGGLLVAVLKGGAAFLPAATAEPVERFKEVKEWTLSVTRRQVAMSDNREGEGNRLHRVVRRFEDAYADGRMKYDARSDTSAMMQGAPGSLPASAAGLLNRVVWKGSGKGAQRYDYELANKHGPEFEAHIVTRGQADTGVVMNLAIQLDKKTFTFEATAPSGTVTLGRNPGVQVTGVPMTLEKKTLTQGVYDPSANGTRTLTILVADQPLPQSGLTLSGVMRAKDPKGSSNGDFFYSWVLEPASMQPKVYLQLDDDSFLPENGNQVSVSLRTDSGKPSKVEFRLLGTSSYRGTCLNDGDSHDTDFEFTPAQAGWAIKDGVALSDSGETRVRLTSLDYAAYTEVAARALIDGNWIDAKSAIMGRRSLPVPRDDNGNRIADIWEDLVKRRGTAIDADDDELPTQAKTKGDNLTFIEEYRGVMTREGTHLRLNPRQREMFVEDEENLLDGYLWEQPTGVRVVFLKPDQHQNQHVNFNGPQALSDDLFALRIVKMSGVDDPTKRSPDMGQWADTFLALANHRAVSRIFLDRIAYGLNTVLPQRVAEALRDPNSEDGKFMYALGHNPSSLQKAQGLLQNAAKLAAMQKRLLRLAVLHELTHACDLNHHSADDTKGDAGCLCRLLSEKEKNFDIFTELGGTQKPLLPFGAGVRLCTTGDDCWSKLRLKAK